MGQCIGNCVASAIIFRPTFSSARESKQSSRPDEFKRKYDKFCPFITFTHFYSLVAILFISFSIVKSWWLSVSVFWIDITNPWN